MRVLRSWRLVWGTAAAAALTVVSLAGTAASAAPSAADAVTQYRVSPAGISVDTLADRLEAAGFDIAGGRDGALFVVAGPDLGRRLSARSDLRVEQRTTVTAQVSAAAGLDDILPSRLDGTTYETFYGGYRTVDAYGAFLADLQQAYPDLVRVVDFGTTSTGANTLKVACVTADAGDGCQLTPTTDKARFLLAGQIHARELSTSEMAWRELTHLVDGYATDAAVTGLLDTTEVWIVPQINPDGIETAQTGIIEDGLGQSSDAWQRKNRHAGTKSCSGGNFSQIGIDLNRNFASNWGGAGTSGDQCNLTYRGTAADSETETTAVEALMQDLFADQRGPNPGDPAPATTSGAMVTMHSYSNLVLFPYGDNRTSPNDAGLRSMGFRMSYYNGYRTGQPDEILYSVTGSTDDWSYETLGIASFTYEIGPEGGACSGFFPAYTCQDGFWDLNGPAIDYAARAATHPYTMGLGPTILTAGISSTDPTRATITATANDGAYGTNGVRRPSAQTVNAARIYYGGSPSDGGRTKPMTVTASGSSATLRLTVPKQASQQLVYVQARDSAGNWGPLSAVYVPAR
ncbi:MAG: hypothetical protein H0T85_08370 [Geodermatophilaceae bacterium]|nr:hypothetical protein [Geodermatophilaceae bacterium]